MERMKLSEESSAPEVYLILRVFNLDKNNIDMAVYVDPEGMRARGDLVFIPESYSVVPG